MPAFALFFGGGRGLALPLAGGAGHPVEFREIVKGWIGQKELTTHPNLTVVPYVGHVRPRVFMENAFPEAGGKAVPVKADLILSDDREEQAEKGQRSSLS